MDDAEHAYLLETRKALLIQVRAIEERLQTRTVTVTVSRADAERLGLIKGERGILTAVSN